MASSVQPSSMVTSSPMTEVSCMVVGFCLFERMVTCLPMMLSVISALLPIMVRSMTALFLMVASLPILV